MSVLSDITMSTLSLQNEIIDKIYPHNEEDPIISYEAFESINFDNNKFYNYSENGLTVQSSRENCEFTISQDGIFKLVNEYVNNGLNSTKNITDGTESQAIVFAEHSLVHAFETVRNAENLSTHIGRNYSSDMIDKITVLSKTSALLHDIGMGNGMLNNVKGISDTFKDYRQNHSLLSGYLILSDSKDYLGADIDKLTEKYNNGTATEEEKEQLKDIYTIALATASHSKSNSQLTSFAANDIEKFLDKFSSKVNEFNEKTDGNVNFDKNLGMTLLLDEKYGQIFYEVSRITSLSDAFAHSSTSLDIKANQIGGSIDCIKNSENLMYNDKIVEIISKDEWNNMFDGNRNNYVCIATDKYGNTEILDEKESVFVVGEHFCRLTEVKYDENGSKYLFDISKLDPTNALEREAALNYISERLFEIPRYFTYENKHMEIGIACQKGDDAAWANVFFSGKIPSLDEAGNYVFAFPENADIEIKSIIFDNSVREYDSNALIPRLNNVMLEELIPVENNNIIFDDEHNNRLDSIKEYLNIYCFSKK